MKNTPESFPTAVHCPFSAKINVEQRHKANYTGLGFSCSYCKKRQAT